MSAFLMALARYFGSLVLLTLGVTVVCGLVVGLCSSAFSRLMGSGSRAVFNVTPSSEGNRETKPASIEEINWCVKQFEKAAENALQEARTLLGNAPQGDSMPHIHVLSGIVKVLSVNVNPRQRIVGLIDFLRVIAVTDNINSLPDTVI